VNNPEINETRVMASMYRWAVSLRFGINSIFLGMSLVMFGLGLKQASEAQVANPLQPFPLSCAIVSHLNVEGVAP
jgi:hypothetical protein